MDLHPQSAQNRKRSRSISDRLEGRAAKQKTVLQGASRTAGGSFRGRATGNFEDFSAPGDFNSVYPSFFDWLFLVQEEPDIDLTVLDAEPPQKGLVLFQTDRTSDHDQFGMQHIVTEDLAKIVEELGAAYASIKSE